MVIQIPVFLVMILDMGYEWIMAVVLSLVLLMYPAVNALFILNKGLRDKLMQPEQLWSIWFGIMFQSAAIISAMELLAGGFREHFNIPYGFWTDFFVYI